MDLQEDFKYLPADFSQRTFQAKQYFSSHFETGKYDIQNNTAVTSSFMCTF